MVILSVTISAAMDDYDEFPGEMPPREAMGDDRPSDNDDKLDDLNDEFDAPAATGLDDSDDESLLSEVDEAQFADFDASKIDVAPDHDALKGIKVSKRPRTEGQDSTQKRREKRREKTRTNRRRRDSDDVFSGGEEISGKRPRKSKPGESGERKKPVRVEVNDDDLPPEERRRRALDRAMDAAVKKSSGARRMKKGEIVSVIVLHGGSRLTLYRIWSRWPTQR